ncbi:MAG: coproporphyrinogen III oxidase [Planctomycetota bacterium]
MDKLRQHISWDKAREVTFECEPGTLSESKLRRPADRRHPAKSRRREPCNDRILKRTVRAHLTSEIEQAWKWIRTAGFRQVNIDLIAGMVGETWDSWRETVKKTIDMDPDSVTIYQMELPYNTRYSKDLVVLEQPLELANWSTKRDWLEFASDEFDHAGYRISSAYTLVKKNDTAGFQYRDNLWHGADLLASGVASFGHLSGVHYQNQDGLENYQGILSEKRLPLGRALPVTAQERLIRELILQMKLGWLDPRYFLKKFGRDITKDFADVFADLEDRGLLEALGPSMIRLSRQGLLRVDSLLPAFFLPIHRTDRYT